MPQNEVLDPAIADLIRTSGQDLILRSATLTHNSVYAVGSLTYALTMTAILTGVPVEDLLDLVSKYHESASIAQSEADDLVDGEVMLRKAEVSV